MAGKGQKRARAQHVLPQFYLRAWANSDDAVAMLMRDGSEVTTGTKALAVETDFYTVTAADGSKSSLVEEEYLKHWDARGAEIHQRLLADDFPLDDDARTDFGFFLGLQWLRGRVARQTGQEAYDVLTKLLVTLGLDRQPEVDTEPSTTESRARATGQRASPRFGGPGIEVPALGHLPDEYKAVLRDTDAYTFKPSREELIHQMVAGAPEAAAVFLETDWLLMRVAGGSLLTSDEPISMMREETPENEWRGMGVGNADLLHFPLSPERGLVMMRAGAKGRDIAGVMPAEIAAQMNVLTVAGWWRQLYRHPDSPAFPPLPPPLPESRLAPVPYPRARAR